MTQHEIEEMKKKYNGDGGLHEAVRTLAELLIMLKVKKVKSN